MMNKLEHDCVFLLNETVCVSKSRDSGMSIREVVKKDEETEDISEDKRRDGGGKRKGKGGKGSGASGKEKKVRIEEF